MELFEVVKESQMKILVVDDERPALEMMLETLERLCPNAEVVFFREAKGVLEYEGKADIDVAFLDIELGRMSGIELALELKKYAHKCNIIFVTSYSEYGTESFKARPSGYVTKPYTDEDIKRELEDLKYPVSDLSFANNSVSKTETKKETLKKPITGNKGIISGKIGTENNDRLKCTTFGNFMVYGKDGNIITFSRTKSKEILAYLIDCAGYPVTTNDIAKDLYETTLDKQLSKNISKVLKTLIDDLKKAGYDDIIIKQNRQIYINKDKISCDIYDALGGDVVALNSYHGEYMLEYTWAEMSEIIARLKKK